SVPWPGASAGGTLSRRFLAGVCGSAAFGGAERRRRVAGRREPVVGGWSGGDFAGIRASLAVTTLLGERLRARQRTRRFVLPCYLDEVVFYLADQYRTRLRVASQLRHYPLTRCLLRCRLDDEGA
ncbi:MAG: hypothetical protein ACRDJN_32120, partial [Chloroflexota bacterium]